MDAAGKTLLVTSQWYSQTVVLRVDVESGAVEPVTPIDPTQGSWTLQVRFVLVAKGRRAGKCCRELSCHCNERL